MYRILICDDDKAIVDSISIYLSNEGYDVEKAYDGLEAVKKLEENEFHCMILDIMMPNLDGLAAANIIRKKHNLPIIMLSAKSEDTDKIAGLQFGADDYVTKPFNPLELVARVKAQIRRYSFLGSLEKKETMLITDGLVLDTEAKSVTVDGEQAKLTAIEYKIVKFLMENMGKIMSSGQIYEAVWNEVPYAAEKTVTVHVRNIRSKIEIDPKNPKYLKVVYGVGYKIEKY